MHLAAAASPMFMHPMQQQFKATNGPSKRVIISPHHPHELEVSGHRSKSWDCEQIGKERDFKQDLRLMCTMPPRYFLVGAPPCRPAPSVPQPNHTPPHHRDTCTSQQASKQAKPHQKPTQHKTTPQSRRHLPPPCCFSESPAAPWSHCSFTPQRI